MKKIVSLVVVLMGLTATTTFAQNDKDTSLYLVVKTDGGEFYGYIIQDDGREILLETKTIGKIYISKADIKSITKVDPEEVNDDGSVKYRDFRTEGPFTTRYYFTTNALPIKKKENYALIHLYGPEVHFAVSDNLSLGVMASWIASPIALAGKYSFSKPDQKSDVHVALGTIMANSGYLYNAKVSGGLHWLTVTKGDRMSNISLSAGYSYAFFNDMWYLGDKYQFSSRQESPYPVTDPGAYSAMRKKHRYDDLYAGRTSAAVLGLGGIAPVGKKASFIFDGMAFFGQAPIINYVPMESEVTYTDPRTQMEVTKTYTIGRGERTYSENWNTTLILMPAMRFSNAYGSSFQVTLSGVIQFKDGDVFSAPVPMVSWLRQF